MIAQPRWGTVVQRPSTESSDPGTPEAGAVRAGHDDGSSPPAGVRIRPVEPRDAEACGRILYEAFATLAAEHGFPPDFESVAVATRNIEGLNADPGFHGVVAEAGGRILGSTFLDERSAIAAIGPVSVDPIAQDGHVGRALMQAMLERAAVRRFPGVRLVQIAYHNRSVSLYAKLGFEVRESLVAIHGAPLRFSVPGYHVRPATAADEAACNALCTQVHGHDRAGELRDALAAGRVRVVERLGRITAYTTGIGYFSHSVAETTDDIEALIAAADDFGRPGFIVPLRNAQLFRWCLAHDLKVFFVMNLMTVGLYQEPEGAWLPSVGY